MFLIKSKILESLSRSERIDRILWLLVAILPVIIFPFYIKEIFDIVKGPVLFIAGFTILILLIQDKKWDNSVVSWLLLCYLFLQFFSSVFAFDPLLAIFGLSKDSGRFEGLVTLIIYSVLFYAAKNHMTITKKKVVTTFSILSIVSVYALIQYFKFDPLVTYKHFRPLTFSTVGNQNFLGSLSIILTILALGLFIHFKNWYYALFFTLFFSTLLVAQARSCWVAFALVVTGIILSVLIFNRNKWDSLLISLFLMLTLIVGLNQTRENVLSKRTKTITKELTFNDEYGGSGRLKIWQISWNVIKKHPVLGAGPENLKLAIKLEDKKGMDDYYKVKRARIDRAHNEYLHIAAVSGIPALMVYFSILLILFYKFRFFFIKDKLKSLLLLTILGYLIQAFFNISVIAVAPVFWTLLGLLAQDSKDYTI